MGRSISYWKPSPQVVKAGLGRQRLLSQKKKEESPNIQFWGSVSSWIDGTTVLLATGFGSGFSLTLMDALNWSTAARFDDLSRTTIKALDKSIIKYHCIIIIIESLLWLASPFIHSFIHSFIHFYAVNNCLLRLSGIENKIKNLASNSGQHSKRVLIKFEAQYVKTLLLSLTTSTVNFLVLEFIWTRLIGVQSGLAGGQTHF